MIRLYGVTIGHGSFGRVTRGMRDALGRLGLLAGFVPIDAYDEEAAYPGYDAPVGVCVGPPVRAGIMTAIGVHEERLAMVAPNSSWAPVDLLVRMKDHLTGFLSPSEWGASVLRGYVSLPVMTWRHGVDRGFTANDDRRVARAAYADGAFEVLHLASTALQRKGTRELIEIWAKLARERLLGAHPVLRLCVDGPVMAMKELAEDACGDDPEALRSIVWLTRLNLSATEMAAFYRRHHVVCQPSRGEGFGCVPLESLACGVPIVVTDCTGHSEYVRRDDPGVVVVETGPDEPVDDGPGAMAPAIRRDSLREAILTAYAEWPDLDHAAGEEARAVGARWSWEVGTERWMQARAMTRGEVA